jgi:hypothetical protein
MACHWQQKKPGEKNALREPVCRLSAANLRMAKMTIGMALAGVRTAFDEISTILQPGFVRLTQPVS